MKIRKQFHLILKQKSLWKEYECAYKDYKGVLPKPFEDFYGLQGEERATYLKIKQSRLTAIQNAKETLAAQGKTAAEIEDYILTNF